MPFKSKEQERYLQINEPEIYRDWVEKYGRFKGAESEADDPLKYLSITGYYPKVGRSRRYSVYTGDRWNPIYYGEVSMKGDTRGKWDFYWSDGDYGIEAVVRKNKSYYTLSPFYINGQFMANEGPTFQSRTQWGCVLEAIKYAYDFQPRVEGQKKKWWQFWKAESFGAEDYVPDRKDLARMGVGLNRKQKEDLFLDMVWERLGDGWDLWFVQYAPDYSYTRDYTPVRKVVIDEEWYDQFSNNKEMYEAFESLLHDGKFEHKYGGWDRTIKNTINEHMIDNYIWGDLYDEDYDYRERMYNHIKYIKSQPKDEQKGDKEDDVKNITIDFAPPNIEIKEMESKKWWQFWKAESFSADTIKTGVICGDNGCKGELLETEYGKASKVHCDKCDYSEIMEWDAESFRSYKVAPDLSSYTKAELVSSIAGPQGTAAYDEVVYDPIAQSRLSAETATQRFKNYGNSLSGDTVCPACGDESWDEYLDGDEWRGICRCGYDFNTGSALENPLLTFYEMEALKEQGKLTSDQKEYLEWRITSTLSDLDSSSRNKKYIQDELVAHGWTLDRWGNAEPPEESASTLVGNAESINSFSPARLIILGASIGVALGLYNTRGE